jgi:hypothetical protein
LGQFPLLFVGQIHRVRVIGIALIELEHGEFWIVLTLVTEVAVNLLNALEASNHQTLKKQVSRAGLKTDMPSSSRDMMKKTSSLRTPRVRNGYL